MSEQGKLNEETAEETAKEQESALSEANPDNCILNKSESSEVEEKEEKLSDGKTELQVRKEQLTGTLNSSVLPLPFHFYDLFHCLRFPYCFPHDFEALYLFFSF